MYYYTLLNDNSLEWFEDFELSLRLKDQLSRGLTVRSVLTRPTEATTFKDLEKIIIELLRDKFELDFKSSMDERDMVQYRKRKRSK